MPVKPQRDKPTPKPGRNPNQEGNKPGPKRIRRGPPTSPPLPEHVEPTQPWPR